MFWDDKMATPTDVVFSPIKKSVETIITELEGILQANEFELFEVSRIGWNPEYKCFGYIGNDITCNSEHDALKISKDWEGFILSYEVLSVGQQIYLYFWDGNNKTRFAIDMTPQVLSFESEEFNEGEWLQKFLISITGTIQADICAYGVPYDDRFFPLLLFGIGLEFQEEFDNKNISKNLRHTFENKGIFISQNATVTIQEKDEHWLIYDPVNKASYSIWKEKGKLNIYVPFDSNLIISNFKNGALFKIHSPVFHMISCELVSKGEMESIIKSHQRSSTLRYFLTTTGYHVFSDLPCDRKLVHEG